MSFTKHTAYVTNCSQGRFTTTKGKFDILEELNKIYMVHVYCFWCVLGGGGGGGISCLPRKFDITFTTATKI